jgi:RNA polymerase sigma-70 factor (ECF subfamily)
MDTIKQLLSEIKKGNQDAFRQFFLQTYDRMKFLIIPYIGDEEIARDLLQDAYLLFWEIRQTIRDDSNPEALLYTLLRNNALNYLKHLKVCEKHSDFIQKNFMEDKLNYYALNDPVSENFFSEEILRIFDSVLKSLPEKTQEIFYLSREQGMKYREIANHLDISEKVVENHIMNALRALREALKEYIK